MHRTGPAEPPKTAAERDRSDACIGSDQTFPLAHSAKTNPSPSLPACIGPVPRSPIIPFCWLHPQSPVNSSPSMSSQVPADLKYAKSHEWARISGDTAVIGITDHAQHELTDIVFVELPAVGRKVKAGEACAVVESVKTASDIYSPLSGEIIAINGAASDNPALVNTDPYTGGSFFTLRLSNSAEAEALLSAAAYSQQIGA